MLTFLTKKEVVEILLAPNEGVIKEIDGIYERMFNNLYSHSNHWLANEYYKMDGTIVSPVGSDKFVSYIN